MKTSFDISTKHNADYANQDGVRIAFYSPDLFYEKGGRRVHTQDGTIGIATHYLRISFEDLLSSGLNVDDYIHHYMDEHVNNDYEIIGVVDNVFELINPPKMELLFIPYTAAA